MVEPLREAKRGAAQSSVRLAMGGLGIRELHEAFLPELSVAF
jgi:hypothetical protein